MLAQSLTKVVNEYKTLADAMSTKDQLVAQLVPAVRKLLTNSTGTDDGLVSIEEYATIYCPSLSPSTTITD